MSNLLTLFRCIRPLRPPTTPSSPWGRGRNLFCPPTSSLAVDGRFLLKNEAAANSVELLQFTDALINQARNEQRKK